MPVVRDFILADERSSGLEGGLLRKTQTEKKKKKKRKKKEGGEKRKWRPAEKDRRVGQERRAFFGDRQGGGSGSEAFEGERKLTGKEGRAEEVAFRTFR